MDLKRNLSLLKYINCTDSKGHLEVCFSVLILLKTTDEVNVFEAIVLKLDFKIERRLLKCRRRK